MISPQRPETSALRPPCLPGGAACLAGHLTSFREEEGLIEQLRFLLKVHGIERVVLIAHQDCAFYTERLHVSPKQVEAKQREHGGGRSSSPHVCPPV